MDVVPRDDPMLLKKKTTWYWYQQLKIGIYTF